MLHNQSALRLEKLARRVTAEHFGRVKEIVLGGGLRPHLVGGVSRTYR